MTQVEYDIGLALLKRLQQRELITAETYISSCNSRFFDRERSLRYAESTKENVKQEEYQQDVN